jgi:hypothetical protein
LFYVCSVLTSALAFPENGPDPELRARGLAQLDRLDELAEIGMKAARLVGARAESAGPEEDPGALAYARAARAVRLCVMLHAKLVKDIGDSDHAERGRADVGWAQAREERKSDTLNLVYRKAERAHGEDLDVVERLMNEATERLDYEDMYGDLMTRPVEEMADEISASSAWATRPKRPSKRFRRLGTPGARLPMRNGPRRSLRLPPWPARPWRNFGRTVPDPTARLPVQSLKSPRSRC